MKWEKPLGTKGALLYMACCHVVRSVRLQAQASECLGFFASLAFRTRVPLAPLCGYPNNKNRKGEIDNESEKHGA